MDQECIYIKGMVCNRCITTIRDLLETWGFRVNKVSLGQVELEKPLPAEGLMTIKELLKPLGFELLEDRTTSLLRQLKEAIKSLIEQNSGALSSIKLSEFLALSCSGVLGDVGDGNLESGNISIADDCARWLKVLHMVLRRLRLSMISKQPQQNFLCGEC